MAGRITPGRILKGGALAALILLVFALIFGYFHQRLQDEHILAEHPPPGSFVDLGGHQLHYRELGTGGFTFVLEAGGGEYSADWSEIEDSLAQMGRVFVYDRAGFGWSEEGPGPRSAQQITTELHRALEEARIHRPFVLVGHSLGGATQTLYAMRYPDEVAGMLLIDPSHKDQLEKLPSPPAWQRFLVTQIPRTAGFGLADFWMHSTDPVKNQARHIRTFGAELRAAFSSAEAWGDGPIDLGDTPIYVLTAGDYSAWPGDSDAEQLATWEIWKSLHDDLTASSTSDIREHRVVQGSGHYIHWDNPQAVIDSARDLVERIDSASHHGDPDVE